MAIPISTGQRGAGNPLINARANPSQFGAQIAGATARAVGDNRQARRAELNVSRETIGLETKRRGERAKIAATAISGAKTLANTLAERFERDQAIEADKLAGEHRIAMARHEERLKSEAPDDGAGYTDALLNQFDEESARTLEGARSTYQRDLLTRALQVRRQQAELAGTGHEIQVRKEKRSTDLQAVLDQKEAELAANPDQAINIVREAGELIDGSNIRPGQKTRLKRTMERRYTRVAVKGLIETGPIEALELMENPVVREALGGDVIALEADAQVALDAGTRVERAARKAAREEAAKTGYELINDGSLTNDWLEANRDSLTVADYRRFQDALRAGPKRTDPVLYSGLLMRAAGEPAKVREEAADLFGRGLMTRVDFNAIFSATKSGSRPSWHTPIGAFVQNRLKPGRFSAPIDQETQQDALLNFFQWANGNPGVTFEEARTKADEFVSEALEKRKLTAQSFELPKGVTGNATTITMDDLEAARTRTADEFENGDIDRAEAIRQSELIQAWQERLEAANAGK